VSAHYSGNDPERGCGLLLLVGAFAFLAFFGGLAVIVARSRR
jgi:hypothetical protein